jgi:SAM-dependent methyltransferase
VRSDAERERLRETFDQAAGIYHRVRPDYPEALYDDLIALAGLAPGDRLLEVGCATGKATLPLARRGFRITCIELGAGLAAAARRNLAGFDVEVVQGRFEDWRPDEPVSCVFAATAWHWLDPGTRYRRAADALRPGGHLALWAQEHVFPGGGDPFFGEIQDVYDEIGEGLPDGTAQPRPGELQDDRAGIEESGLFDVVGVRQYAWDRVYRAEEYIELLNTFSGHLTMESWQRERLYGEIRRRLGERPDQSVRRGWGAVLHVARRREPALRGGAGGRVRRGGRARRGALDLAEELGVGGRLVGLVQQELERLLGIEGAEGAAELGGRAVFVGRHQQLVAAGAGRQRVDGRVDALLGQLAA